MLPRALAEVSREPWINSPQMLIASSREIRPSFSPPAMSVSTSSVGFDRRAEPMGLLERGRGAKLEADGTFAGGTFAREQGDLRARDAV